MFITCRKNNLYSVKIYKTKLYWSALHNIVLYKMSATDLILDQFLKKEYSMGLKLLCKYILTYGCKITYNSKNEFVIIFKTKYFDNLATLITYGNGKILGSPILNNAFI